MTSIESSKNTSAFLVDKKEDIGTAHLFKSYIELLMTKLKIVILMGLSMF